MKTMTCKQLGGTCDKGFTAETFEEVVGMSRDHSLEMFRAGDSAHMEAMSEMSELMTSPDDMQKWIDERREEFDSLPHE